MRWRMHLIRLTLIAISAIALALAAQGILLAASTAQLSVAHTNTLPKGPDDSLWNKAPEVDVLLNAQSAVSPALSSRWGSAVKVRAMNDGKSVAFLVEWPDPTRDVATVRRDQFRDAVALQFSVGDGIIGLCMGSPGVVANLWHWKADWQEDIDKGYQELPQAYPNFFKDQYPYATGTPPFDVTKDFSSPEAKAYLIGQAAGNPLSQMTKKSPVEELLTVGFGTVSSKAAQNVDGKGVWSDGKWQVMFVRPMSVQDADAPQFTVGKTATLAVAVWDGANQEVGARKQASSYVTFEVTAPAGAGAKAATIESWSIPLIVAPLLGLIVFMMSRREKKAMVYAGEQGG